MAVITGGSRGIGKAIALKLASEGASLCLIGRNLEGLRETACQAGVPAHLYRTDLSVPDEVETLVGRLQADLVRVDILVHNAAIYDFGSIEQVSVEEFDHLFAVNVRAPFRLTQALLPALRQAKGQVVFINSMVVCRAAPNLVHYAATKHALRSLADSLREEVNEAGIKVVSIYPGRTAGAIQEWLYQVEKSPYQPDRLTQPEDLAETVFHALIQPRTIELTDVFTRPFRKLLVYFPFVYPLIELVEFV